MYCHWALHVDLNDVSTIGRFLQQVDAYVNGVLVGPEDFAASYQMTCDFALFDTFRMPWCTTRDLGQIIALHPEIRGPA